MKKRTMALLAAVLLIVGGIIGGTLAWLTAKTTPVVNTFTTSDININLTEETGEIKNGEHHYKMIPGWDITKDPKVTVIGGSEDCYLFVRLEKSANYDTYLEPYVVVTTGDKAWTKLEGDGVPETVYYQKVAANAANQEFDILEGNKVTVKEDVTKTMMQNVRDNNNYPKLTVTAYASQLYKKNGTGSDAEFTPLEAWNNVPKN